MSTSKLISPYSILSGVWSMGWIYFIQGTTYTHINVNLLIDKWIIVHLYVMWLIETNIYWQYFVSLWPQFVFFCENDNFSLILSIMQHVYECGRPWIISIKRRVYELIPKMARRVEPSDLTCRVPPEYLRSHNAWYHGPLTWYAKLRVAHGSGMPGSFFPSPTSKETAS